MEPAHRPPVTSLPVRALGLVTLLTVVAILLLPGPRTVLAPSPTVAPSAPAGAAAGENAHGGPLALGISIPSASSGTVPGAEGGTSWQLPTPPTGATASFSGPGTSYPAKLPPGGEHEIPGATHVYYGSPSNGARMIGVLHPFPTGSDAAAPGPDGAAPAPAAVAAAPRSASYLQNGSLGWDGVDYLLGQLTPPDGSLAVGGGYVMEMVNAEFEIWTTSGTYVNKQTFDAFWSSTAFLGDLYLNYDDVHNRWIALTINITTYILIFSVSQTSDPTGAWWEYILPNIGSSLPDQPFTGVDSSTYAVTANDGGSNYEAWFLNLSAIESGVTPAPMKTFAPTASLGSVRPARTYQPDNTLYLAGDNFGNGATAINLLVATGSPRGPSPSSSTPSRRRPAPPPRVPSPPGTA